MTPRKKITESIHAKCLLKTFTYDLLLKMIHDQIAQNMCFQVLIQDLQMPRMSKRNILLTQSDFPRLNNSDKVDVNCSDLFRQSSTTDYYRVVLLCLNRSEKVS